MAKATNEELQKELEEVVTKHNQLLNLWDSVKQEQLKLLLF